MQGHAQHPVRKRNEGNGLVLMVSQVNGTTIAPMVS